jgi:hypothetical protein
MRLMGMFLTLCVALAVLKAAAKVFALAIIAVVIGSLLIQPKRSLGCLAGMMCLGMIGQYPGPAALVIGAVIIAGKLVPTAK